MLLALVVVSLIGSAGAGKLEDKIKTKAEEIGTETLGVPVQVGNVEIFAWNGLVEIHDVVIDNPPGYSSEYFLKTGKIAVDVHTWKAVKSFGSDIHIEHVQVTCLDLQYERTWTSSNVREIKANLESKQKPDAGGEKPTDDTEQKETDVYVQKVNITGVSAHTRFVGLPPAALMLGDIYKEDFSNEMKGASGMTAVFSILMDTVIKSIAQNAKNMLGKAHSAVAKLSTYIPGVTIEEKEKEKTCFEKRAEEQAAAEAAKKKGFFGRMCGNFELGEVALQSNSALFIALLVSVGGLMSAAVVMARRRWRGSEASVLARVSTDEEDTERLCGEVVE